MWKVFVALESISKLLCIVFVYSVHTDTHYVHKQHSKYLVINSERTKSETVEGSSLYKALETSINGCMMQIL